MLVLKITTVGGSAALIVPGEVLTRLQVKIRDTLCLTETQDGGYRLSPSPAELEGQARLAADIMREDQELLRRLSE